MPELRADRLRTIAERVVREFGGGLEALMKRPLTEVRKALKSFPTIGDPGADRIILFTGKAPVAAVPANALDVPIRLGFGRAARSWGTSYRAAQRALDQTLPRTVPARRRAYPAVQAPRGGGVQARPAAVRALRGIGAVRVFPAAGSVMTTTARARLHQRAGAGAISVASTSRSPSRRTGGR